jgi:hypothetical protein
MSSGDINLDLLLAKNATAFRFNLGKEYLFIREIPSGDGVVAWKSPRKATSRPAGRNMLLFSGQWSRSPGVGDIFPNALAALRAAGLLKTFRAAAPTKAPEQEARN